MEKRTSTKVLFLGFFLAAGCGAPLLFRLLYSVPKATVTECETSWSHKYYAHVRLDSGRQLSLTSDDIGNAKECISSGTSVEKRLFELGYRVNGQYQRPRTDTWRVVPFLAAAGAVLILVSLAIRRRERRTAL